MDVERANALPGESPPASIFNFLSDFSVDVGAGVCRISRRIESCIDNSHITWYWGSAWDSNSQDIITTSAFFFAEPFAACEDNGTGGGDMVAVACGLTSIVFVGVSASITLMLSVQTPTAVSLHARIRNAY